MRNRKPPFEITNTILDKITEIAELVDHVNASLGLSANRIPAKMVDERTIKKIRIGKSWGYIN